VIFSRLLAGLSLIFCVVSDTKATPLLASQTPEQFFDQVAGSLLKAELNLDLHHIQIYPTNRYSSEVHRLLQVTANLYDATTNRGEAYPWFPTCFRPRFLTNEDEVYITGYVEETGGGFIQHPWRDVGNPTDRPINPDDNVYGIPIILGAKKGFPNVNEVASQTVVDVTRKVEVRKDAPSGRLIQTNQMFMVGISNTVAVELWHPWSNDYSRPLWLHAALETTARLTNAYGVAAAAVLSAVSNSWLSAADRPLTNQQFIVPLMPTFSLLSNAVFSTVPFPHFDPVVTNVFESAPAFPTNHWGIETTSRLLLYVFDGSNLVDYVTLPNLRGGFDLSEILAGNPGASLQLWDTNASGTVTYGVRRQIDVSLGNISVLNWSDYGFNQLTGMDKDKSIDLFRTFLGLPPIHAGTTAPTNVAMQTPFTPTRRMMLSVNWEANDPLLHQLTHQFQLGDHPPFFVRTSVPVSASLPIADLSTIGRLNRRYSPWGGNPEIDPALQTFAVDITLKDPGVYEVDRWQFPQGVPLNLSTIGQIHRGTPWQTIYLKSAVAQPFNWALWYGDTAGHPTNDWQLVDILAPLLRANSPQQLLSVNSRNTDDWVQIFTGALVATNDTNCAFSEVLAEQNLGAVAAVILGIEQTRSNSDHGYFDGLGSILATPELSVASPWFNRFDPYCLDYYLTDAAVEALPAQLLPKLRPDPVAYVSRNSDTIGVRFQLMAGHRYAILRSDDLTTWMAVSTNLATESSFTISTDPAAQHAFYKLRLVE